MMEGLKKRTRKAFGIRKKEKDTDSTGSPDRDGGEPQDTESPQKKTNGAPNGFYGEIDWDRYNSPEVDEEGYSIRPDEDEGAAPKEKSYFFSSSESEEEEDHRKKFKIKIRPLPADANIAAPSVDELKASIGNISLSPSPLRNSPKRSPGLAKRNTGEEIARPRRPVPTPAPAPAPSPTPAPAPPPEPASNKKSPVPEDATALFGPPLETAFDEQKTSEVVIEEPEVWGAPLPEQHLDSSLARPFPTGTLPPLPPKNVPTSPPPIESAATELTDGHKEVETLQRPSITDLDNIFGPEDSSKPGEDVGDKWVCFNDESPKRPPLPSEGEPAPPLPSSPPPPAEPAPPLPKSPPPSEEPNPPLPKSPPPPAEMALSPPSIKSPKDSLPPVPKDTTPSPPTVPPPPVEEAPPTPKSDDLSLSKGDFSLCAPLTKTQSDPTNSPPTTIETSERTIPSPLVLNQEDKKSPEENPTKEDPSESRASPKEIGQGPRSTPPPPPPPTYRAVVSSPGPIPPAGTSGNESGSSSPARPSTPLDTSSSPPPPPPPRPPSRPKLPPGKPSVGDVNRPFSPPVHSSSPPPLAPLARAESTSSISSINSLSAATTPTVGKELSVSVSETDQPSLVWFDRGKFYLTFEGCSRGPSPLTMGAQDTLPVAAAFTETVSAYFKGADPNKCVVKITGEMVLSFPAGITRHFANNSSPAVLTFSITNYSRLEHVLPNPQLLCCDTTQPNPNSKEFWVNMPNLMTHLKKVAEQKPQATYYNVDMLKYQVLQKGPQSTPLNLAVSWRCEPTSTDLRIDYKYNGGAMTTPVALNNVQFLIPVDGGVSKLQAVLPPAAWNAEQQKILWKIPDISQKSENGGVGSLLARFQLTEGPSKPAPVAVQFTSEGSTLSGCDIELVGLGYRFSLVKKRFAAGKYMADN
ncbi:SH3-containing GRB2-like protein 3-interacting protein 1 isoform X1 [Cyprinus carpio]|uniref:SH3-containing GRB2-like protein 3-interacting protein 1 isoform X1 n=1 Tax=Cyprinus carpio TaxID=7962 RepID=A0A9Q9Y5Z8_CYPCA|nr:SH3-containing GRB2-like protein 3-interacting protein 1 isoform X1 [Cyprinus carpio]XP_042614269.1 SH3-containing GRB2-like protein 3-interacting protein 1 isoform X1 [Cyprinus carpio]